MGRAIAAKEKSGRSKSRGCADGGRGEGTAEALVDGMGGQYGWKIPVTGPLGKTVKARYGFIREKGRL